MKYASLQQLFLHKKILPLQTVQSCYRKLCIVVTEIGALLLPKSEHSRLPKSVHLSLPFTSSTNQVRLEPTLYNLELVGPNRNILCQINTVFTGCLQLFFLPYPLPVIPMAKVCDSTNVWPTILRKRLTYSLSDFDNGRLYSGMDVSEMPSSGRN